MKSFKSIFYDYIHIPFLFFHILAYRLSRNKNIIDEDIKRWSMYRKYVDLNNLTKSFVRLVIYNKPFRNTFYLRIGKHAFLLKRIFPGLNSIELTDDTEQIGGGLLLVHGHMTILNGSVRIGKNCTILHGVTIGADDHGVPKIGNNVYIGCNATIIGNVTVGDNVKIGACTLICKNVPDNTTVVGNPARIVKKDGMVCDILLSN